MSFTKGHMTLGTFKFNKRTTRSQAHIKKDIPPTKEQTKNNIQLYMQYAQDTDVRIFNLFVDLCNKFKTVYVSHKQLAEWSGFSIGTVRNSIRRLKEAGLLFTQYRGVKQTLYYKVAHHLFTPEIRYALSHLVPALQFVALTLLFTPKNCQSESLTLINKSYLNISTSSKTRYIDNTKTKYIGFGGDTIFGSNPVKEIFKIKRWSVVMKQLQQQGLDIQSNPISPAIRNITTMKLTKWGQIRLSAFPDEVIKYAESRMDQIDIKDHFSYFWKLCLKACQEMKIAPDWCYYYTLAEKYGLSDNSPLLLGEKENTRNKMPLGGYKSFDVENSEYDMKLHIKIVDESGNTKIKKRAGVYASYEKPNNPILDLIQEIANLEKLRLDPSYQEQIKHLGCDVYAKRINIYREEIERLGKI